MNRNELVKGMEKERVLFGTFFAFGNRLQTVGDAFYEEITCKQFFLLICLSLFEDAPTIRDLSDVMGSSHQNVKQIVNKLVEKGFVKITSDHQDKRKIRVEMTKKMDEMKDKYEQREIAFMKHLYTGVSQEEMSTTLRTLQKIEKNLIQ